MRYKYAALLMMILTGAFSHGQSFDWARQAGYHSYEYANAVSADANGNAYVVGEMSPQTEFDTVTFGGSFIDSFIAKYSPSGYLIWVKQITGADTESALAIHTDAQGNSYVTGMFDATATFDGISVTSNGDYDGFLAKYDSEGDLIWATNFGGGSADNGAAVCLSATGNILVAGSFTLSASFGSLDLTSQGQSDIFVAEFDQQGTAIWAKRYGGQGNDYAKAISAKDGPIQITGSFQGTATFDQISVMSAGHYDVFIASLDDGGNTQWCERAGSNNVLIGEAGTAITTDANGTVFICGTTGGTSTFGTHSFTSTDGGDYSDAFVAAYAPDGTCLWVRHGGGIVADGAASIMIDVYGRIIITGSYNFAATFDQLSLPPIGQSASIFVACYDADGSLIWLKNAGGGWGPDAGKGICSDNVAGLYVVGSFYRSAIFDDLELPWMYNETNIFVAHMQLDELTTYVHDLGTDDNSLWLYPNPAMDRIRIRLPETLNGPFAVSIYDPLGHQVHSMGRSEFTNGMSQEMTFPTLRSGMYLCKVRSEKGVWSGRLVIRE